MCQTSYLSFDVRRTECVGHTIFSVMTPVSKKNTKTNALPKYQLCSKYVACNDRDRDRMRPCKRKMCMRECMCRWLFEFPIISPQPERHLEHQTTLSPVKMHVLCVDVLL